MNQFIILLLLPLSILSTNTTTTLQSGNIRAEFNHIEPVINFYLSSDSTINYMMHWSGFTELNETEDKVQEASFGTDFNYSDVARLYMNGTWFRNINMTASIKMGSSHLRFYIFYYMYENDTVIGSDQITAGTLIYKLNMSSWPFVHKRNTLQLLISLSSSRNNRTETEKLSDDSTLISLIGSVNDSLEIKLNSKCLTKSNDTESFHADVDTNIAIEGNEKPVVLSLGFPYFVSLSYDPVVTIDYHPFTPITPIVPDEDGESEGITIFMSAAGAVLFVLGIIAAFFVWRRHQFRKHYFRY